MLLAEYLDLHQQALTTVTSSVSAEIQRLLQYRLRGPGGKEELDNWETNLLSGIAAVQGHFQRFIQTMCKETERCQIHAIGHSPGLYVIPDGSMWWQVRRDHWSENYEYLQESLKSADAYMRRRDEELVVKDRTISFLTDKVRAKALKSYTLKYVATEEPQEPNYTDVSTQRREWIPVNEDDLRNLVREEQIKANAVAMKVDVNDISKDIQALPPDVREAVNLRLRMLVERCGSVIKALQAENADATELQLGREELFETEKLELHAKNQALVDAKRALKRQIAAALRDNASLCLELKQAKLFETEKLELQEKNQALVDAKRALELQVVTALNDNGSLRHAIEETKALMKLKIASMKEHTDTLKAAVEKNAARVIGELKGQIEDLQKENEAEIRSRENAQQLMSSMKQQYAFLEDEYNALYRQDKRHSKLREILQRRETTAFVGGEELSVTLQKMPHRVSTTGKAFGHRQSRQSAIFATRGSTSKETPTTPLIGQQEITSDVGLGAETGRSVGRQTEIPDAEPLTHYKVTPPQTRAHCVKHTSRPSSAHPGKKDGRQRLSDNTASRPQMHTSLGHDSAHSDWSVAGWTKVRGSKNATMRSSGHTTVSDAVAGSPIDDNDVDPGRATTYLNSHGGALYASHEEPKEETSDVWKHKGPISRTSITTPTPRKVEKYKCSVHELVLGTELSGRTADAHTEEGMRSNARVNAGVSADVLAGGVVLRGCAASSTPGTAERSKAKKTEEGNALCTLRHFVVSPRGSAQRHSVVSPRGSALRHSAVIPRGSALRNPLVSPRGSALRHSAVSPRGSSIERATEVVQHVGSRFGARLSAVETAEVFARAE